MAYLYVDEPGRAEFHGRIMTAKLTSIIAQLCTEITAGTSAETTIDGLGSGKDPALNPFVRVFIEGPANIAVEINKTYDVPDAQVIFVVEGQSVDKVRTILTDELPALFLNGVSVALNALDVINMQPDTFILPFSKEGKVWFIGVLYYNIVIRYVYT